MLFLLLVHSALGNVRSQLCWCLCKPGLPPMLDREQEEMVEGTAKQAQASVCVAGAEE